MEDPGEVLTKARNAVKKKDYTNALNLYEYFFDHAMDDKISSYYGVRLSYCLNEWTELGKIYPGANDQLIKKREESLNLLKETQNPERFNDYKSISEYLEIENETIEVFVNLHKSHPELAEKCALFIWDKLVESKQWDICEHYLGQPEKKIKYAFQKFDQSMKISKDNPGYGGEEFDKQIIEWLVTDTSNILHVLKNCNRMKEFEEIQQTAYEKIKSRGHIELVKVIESEINI